jgi:MraZ protein
VFRGHFRHTIDPKGRLSIPSKFREGLRESGSDRLVIAPHDKWLDVFPEDKWRELEEKIAQLAKLDPDGRQFQHAYLSAGLDVLLDPHGRIQILQDYRERCGLAKNVLIVGMLNHFEIWDEGRWDMRQRELSPLEDLEARLAAKGV